MKAAVGHIAVFSAAALTHVESGHRRVGPVIGKIPDNTEPGAAMCAIHERIGYPARVVFHVIQALITHGDIRADACNLRGAVPACQYPKTADRYTLRQLGDFNGTDG